MYSHIVDFYQAINRYVDITLLPDEKTIEKENELLWKAVDLFKDYTEKHRIYFSEEICIRLDSLYETADEPISSLMAAAVYSGENGQDRLVDSWREAKSVLEDNVKKIRETLENDFRELLGVKY